MRGHCCMSPARREAVFWEAEAATGAAAVAPRPSQHLSLVKVPGLISGSFSQLCERLRLAPRRPAPESIAA